MKEVNIIEKLRKKEGLFWENTNVVDFQQSKSDVPFSPEDIEEADLRLRRFSPFIKEVFPETKENNGLIESELVSIPKVASEVMKEYQLPDPVNLYLKKDSHLPISGSVKARGGIYEVLFHAEKLALEAGMLRTSDDYGIFNSEKFRDFFSKHKIVVASTGNLGLSIGIISSHLGFKCDVHMSYDAKAWKKDKLRTLGVHVIEHNGDYSVAVKKGKAAAATDPHSYFIDDETSPLLFLGYSVAALRLKNQLKDLKIAVDENHPLYVYLPCGVGGAPGGISFGLKTLFGNQVKVIFAEPVSSPSVFLGTYTRKFDEISVYDIGLDNKTIADGLAVGCCSSFVTSKMYRIIDMFYTLSDQEMLHWMKIMFDTEGIKLEPSALSALPGFAKWFHHSENQYDFDSQTFFNATHIAWATGGSMLPLSQFEAYLKG